MPEPWDADRELDTECVKRVLAGQFPHLSLDSVELLGSGWDYDAYLIDEDLVVRFPRRLAVAGLLDREQDILAFVRENLNEALTIPEIIIRGEQGSHFPYPFIGHKFIRGTAADDPATQLSADFFADLGLALRAIHSIPETSYAKRLFQLETERISERFAETSDLLERDSRIAELVPEAYEWIMAGPEMPSEHPGPPRFIHNDICPDHIIADPGTGRLSGIIDWSDAAFGDPVWDFVVLPMWAGRDALECVLDSYGCPLGEGFDERLRILARVSSLKWLVDAVKQGTDVKKHMQWVENAFRS